MATKLIMVGAKGRMGQAILTLAHADKGFEVVAEVDHGDDLSKVTKGAQVLVDFSHRSATAAVLKQVVSGKLAYVCGTTGHILSGGSAVKHIGQRAAANHLGYVGINHIVKGFAIAFTGVR